MLSENKVKKLKGGLSAAFADEIKMKRINRLSASVLIIALVLVLALSGCGKKENNVDLPKAGVSEPVNIAALNGPTGMGLVELMGVEGYNVDILQAPTDVVPKLLNGEVDVACIPSNLAAVIYSKAPGKTVCISPMIMGVLHILGNNTDIYDLEELKGMTIVAAGQGGTPEYALRKILKSAGVNPDKDVKIEWLANHADVNSKLQAEEGVVALLPEPFVSVALSSGNENIIELFDMNTEWTVATGQNFPMGVLVASRDFVENRADDFAVLLADIKKSIAAVDEASDEICQKIVDAGFIAKPEIAKAAIPNCGLTFYIDEEGERSLAAGREIMEVFNETMFKLDPKAVGGELPGDDFFYQP